ncbi:uncharacterized protein LOC127750633 [Frankliniella occidentalis]|uniref:Uncharacterized protein LOC127750633 n=1 Tax=Frankliniella occidentalis TaxID=133901 RepID=A0A9C6X415_FRAOC|nr:uncharacterized protein LOC127750633 [Frankliniella occidentalis]
MRSQYPDPDRTYPMNTLAYDAGMKFQSILPRKFNKFQQWLDAMNKPINNKVGPKVVFYGTMSLSYEVELLRQTQEPCPEKLEIVQRIMMQTTPKKGDSQMGTASPNKRSHVFDEQSPSKRK